MKKAKDLLAAGKTCELGCSQLVREVLGLNEEEDADALMGDRPRKVGVDNNYEGIEPGDIVGWISKQTANPNGHGHVSVYIGDLGTQFIDVPDTNEKPRALKRGYGRQPLFKSSRF